MIDEAATVPVGVASPEARQRACDVPQAPGFWRETLSVYARPRLLRNVVDFVTSVVAYLAVSVAVYFALDLSPALVLAPVSAVFLLRTYIIFHDCSHGSSLVSRRANAWLGTLCGLLVLSPFVRWRHDHAVHHATSGDLDKRGVGDLPTLTVAEYQQRSRRGRLGYRIIRSPVVMFGLAPVRGRVLAAFRALELRRRRAARQFVSQAPETACGGYAVPLSIHWASRECQGRLRFDPVAPVEN